MTSDRTCSRRLALIAAGALVAAFAVATAAPTLAHESKAGDIRLVHAWAPPSIPGARNGAAYFVALENGGSAADRLVSASSPVAARVEMHTMSMDGSVMRMREVEAIPVAARQKVEMKPGSGYHFMLMDLKQPLKAGDAFPMRVVFEKAGPVEVNVVVQERKAADAAPPEHKH